MHARTHTHTQDLVLRLNAGGFPTLDLSAMELAQTHLRHIVGGRARSYTGTIPNERLMQVQFPERPGALKRFLEALSPSFNITLFHYRKTGATQANVLCGLQVSPAQEPAFDAAVSPLRGDYSFTQLSPQDEEVFNMFIK